MTVRERNIQLPMEAIGQFCLRHPIGKLSLFGSALREDFGAESDLDFLVELEPGSGVGLIGLMGMQHELEDLTGRRVDLRSPEDLHPRFRQKVVREAEVLYARQN